MSLNQLKNTYNFGTQNDHYTMINDKFKCSTMGAPTIKPVKSLGGLEKLFWEKTRENNKECQFITDGKNSSDLTSIGNDLFTGQNQSSTYVDPQKVLDFITQTNGDQVVWYHTHPHIEKDGSQKKVISPPSYNDFVMVDTVRPASKKPLVARVIERYGVWEYSANAQDLPHFDIFTRELLDTIEKNKDSSIDGQVRVITKLYGDNGMTTSFRRIEIN